MTMLHPHCGQCSQCIDRRFAILAAGQEHEDPAEAYKVDLFLGERESRAGPGNGARLCPVGLDVEQMTDVDFLRALRRNEPHSRLLSRNPRTRWPAASSISIGGMRPPSAVCSTRRSRRTRQPFGRKPACGLLAFPWSSDSAARTQSIRRDSRVTERAVLTGAEKSECHRRGQQAQSSSIDGAR